MNLTILWFIVVIVVLVCDFLLGYGCGYDRGRKGLDGIEMQMYGLEKLNKKLSNQVRKKGIELDNCLRKLKRLDK